MTLRSSGNSLILLTAWSFAQMNSAMANTYIEECPVEVSIVNQILTPVNGWSFAEGNLVLNDKKPLQNGIYKRRHRSSQVGLIGRDKLGRNTVSTVAAFGDDKNGANVRDWEISFLRTKGSVAFVCDYIRGLALYQPVPQHFLRCTVSTEYMSGQLDFDRQIMECE